MFKQEFKNKKIVFLGDSGVADGRYIHNMRAYMHDKEDRCYLINRGIGGNRVDMIDCLIEDEVFSIKPDYCISFFGVNDMGIWLYDSFKEITPELLAEREKRDQSFYDANKRFIKYCKEHGVKPILVPPYLVNELLEEKPDIPTLGDNKEKAELLGPWFYKRKTFENINNKIRVYSDFLRDLAKSEGALFIDLFETSYAYMREMDGLFGPDGIHMTDKGHQCIAKLLLEFLGYENVPLEFVHGEGADELWQLERKERSPYFVKYNMFNAVNGNFTEEEITKECQSVLEKEGQPAWLKRTCTNYLKDKDNLEENKKAYLEAIMKY